MNDKKQQHSTLERKSDQTIAWNSSLERSSTLCISRNQFIKNVEQITISKEIPLIDEEYSSLLESENKEENSTVNYF